MCYVTLSRVFSISESDDFASLQSEDCIGLSLGDQFLPYFRSSVRSPLSMRVTLMLETVIMRNNNKFVVATLLWFIISYVGHKYYFLR